MQFYEAHNVDQKIKSLSERLRYLGKDTASQKNTFSQSVRTENLQNNISLILSHIITNLSLIDRSVANFVKIINDYNEKNNTTVSFQDFEKILWVRVINEEVFIPETVRSYVWKVGYDESQNKSVVIPNDKNDLIRIVQKYNEVVNEDSRPTISKDGLKKLLNKYAPGEINTDFFITNGILRLNIARGVYEWIDHQYSNHINNEIASTVWLLLGGENTTEADFRRYVKIFSKISIYPTDIASFLTPSNAKRICDFGTDVLLKEDDLINSHIEFAKIWLDHRHHHFNPITDEIPSIQLNAKNSYDLIGEIEFHQWRFHDLFNHQHSRNAYNLILKLIIQTDLSHPRPYKTVSRLFNDHTRPFIVWSLYTKLPEFWPEVIPYLLYSSSLIPISFKLLDKIKVAFSLLSEVENDKKVEEQYAIINTLWLELFDFILLQSVHSLSEISEVGFILYRILTDVSGKVFLNNSNTGFGNLSHSFFRKRYETVLNKLKNIRFNKQISFHNSNINPRYIFFVLPEIINPIKDKIKNDVPSHTYLVTINAANLDLGIEILRLINLQPAISEIPDTLKEILRDIKQSLTEVLKNEIVNFFYNKEVDVQVYYHSERNKQRATRSIKDFGYEIIAWGYLFLNFQEYSFISSVDNIFRSGLEFDNSDNKDEYDDQNKEQADKIKLYLKSLMLAYLDLNNNKEAYQTENLPVRDTIRILEELVVFYSSKFSVTNLQEKRVDVFDEKFTFSGNDIYNQSLISLLYHCINFFNPKISMDFITHFFEKSIDIGRMLTAINTLDSIELKDVISNKISQVSINDFIQSTFWATELESALIQAVNSDSHWDLAEPLLNRIIEHFENRNIADERSLGFIFEIKLLIAFKKKSWDELKSVEVPKRQHQFPASNPKDESKKVFYDAIFKIYNENKYDEAIMLLESLLSNDTKNIMYAFHAYKAKTLKALNK